MTAPTTQATVGSGVASQSSGGNTGVAGSQDVRLTIGGAQFDVAPSSMNYLTIISDLDLFLPSISLSLNDESGFLTHVMPANDKFNEISVEFVNSKPGTALTFTALRRFPQSETFSQTRWEIEGLLKVPGLFSPTRQRVFKNAKSAKPMTVKEILTFIAEEMKCIADISPEMDFTIDNVYQPSVSNAFFLRYLEERLMGKTSQTAFYCLFRPTATPPEGVTGSAARMMFKSLDELLADEPSPEHNFKYGIAKFDEDAGLVPAYNFQLADSSTIMRWMGVIQLVYKYFDFASAEYVSKTLGLTRLEGFDEGLGTTQLADYIAIGDTAAATPEFWEMNGLGRSSEFTPDFAGIGKGYFAKRVQHLLHAWIDVDPQFDIYPGDLIKLEFPEQWITKDLMPGYQHAGYWLVKRVIQSISNVHITRLLITRCGYNTVAEVEPELVKAQNVKGKE